MWSLVKRSSSALSRSLGEAGAACGGATCSPPSRTPSSAASATGRSVRSRRDASQPRSSAAVDDHAVGEIDELLPRRVAEGRLSAPAAEDGQIRDHERQHDRRRRLGSIPAQPQLDHLAADVTATGGETAQRELGVEPVGLVGKGHQDQRARRMAFREAGERRLGRVEPPWGRPGAVRHHARPQVRRGARHGRRLAQPSKLPLDRRDRRVLAHCSWISSARVKSVASPTIASRISRS